MVDTRTWALIAGGVAAGGAVIGTAVWRARRVHLRPLGRIYRIAGRYYAEAAVVEELLRRVPGAEPWGEDQGGRLYLFPERLPVTPPTGPGWPVVSKPMEERQPALVFELDGFYLNAEALRRIRTRIPLNGDRFVWRSTPLQLVPRGDSVGKLVRVETLSGGHDDDAIRAFIGQLLLHRIVERMELPPDARVNTPPDARVTSGSTSVPEETS